MQSVADSIRTVTAIAQQRFDDGERSAAIDLHDVVELLLAIADELDAAGESDLLAAAKAQKAMFILVVEEVPHGEMGVVRSSRERITHEHPTLHDFYEHTRPADHGHDDDSQIFVEVSAFLIQGDYAKLFWSGTTWEVETEGGEDRIAGLSATIADAIEEARRQYLNRDG